MAGRHTADPQRRRGVCRRRLTSPHPDRGSVRRPSAEGTGTKTRGPFTEGPPASGAVHTEGLAPVPGDGPAQAIDVDGAGVEQVLQPDSAELTDDRDGDVVGAG